MPRLDLILLPLLGGYIFLITFNITKYYHLRLERQKLIYNSLAAAVLLSIFTYLLDYYILKSNFSIICCLLKTKSLFEYRTDISSWIDSVLNIKSISGLKHSILIFIISYPIAKLMNIFFSRNFAFDYTIERWGNHLDRLIWFSLTEKNDEDKLLMLTTKGNKVYVGYINKLSEPIGEAYMTIIPNFSGYRNKDNLKLEITTIYTDVIEKYVLENRESEIGNKLGVILPVSEILFVSRFDSEIFGRFNENDSINDTIETPSITRKLLNFLADFF